MKKKPKHSCCWVLADGTYCGQPVAYRIEDGGRKYDAHCEEHKRKALAQAEEFRSRVAARREELETKTLKELEAIAQCKASHGPMQKERMMMLIIEDEFGEEAIDLV